MRLTNAQLRILFPLVLEQAKENPSPEWDDLVERMVRVAWKRRSTDWGMVKMLYELVPKHDVLTVAGDDARPAGTEPETHPLLGGMARFE